MFKGNILFLVFKINFEMKKNEFMNQYESIYNCDELPNVIILILNVD